MSKNKPLITIALFACNQERFVREAVRSVLSQTYEPLEIIISDDCSTDRTWDILQEEVRRYRGEHTRIVLNRNKHNLGIVRHFEAVFAIAQGSLIVVAEDDDISESNRVEKVVEAWERSGRRATWIMNNGQKVDESGAFVGNLSAFHSWLPLGAASSYCRLKADEWPKIEDSGCFEDWICSRRAMMLGEFCWIPDQLMKYRVGSGVSSKVRNFRQVKGSNESRMLHTCNQMEMDLESKKSILTDEMFQTFKTQIKLRRDWCKSRDLLYNGETFAERKRGFLNAKPLGSLLHPGNLLAQIVSLCCLLPPGRFDFLAQFFANVEFLYKKWRLKA